MLINGPAHGRKVNLRVEVSAIIVPVGGQGLVGHAGYRRDPTLDSYGACAYSFVRAVLRKRAPPVKWGQINSTLSGSQETEQRYLTAVRFPFSGDRFLQNAA